MAQTHLNSVEKPAISLLWQTPQGVEEARHLHEDCARDLELDEIIRAFIPKSDFRYKGVREIFINLCMDGATIQYRQAVIKDLLNNPKFVAGLQDIAPHISAMDYRPQSEKKDEAGLFEVAWQLGQVELFASAIQKFHTLFNEISQPLQSVALRQLESAVKEVMGDPVFQDLVEELPALREQMQSIASITIGVNLDTQMRPVEATLVSVNKERYRESTFLKRMFKRSEMQGLTEIHGVPRSPVFAGAGSQMRIYIDHSDYSPSAFATEPVMVPLFRDLLKVTRSISEPVAKALQKYLSQNTDFFKHFQKELPFFLGAVALITNMQEAGMPMCCPEILPPEARTCQLRGAYNLNLALHMKNKLDESDVSKKVIPNDLEMGPEGRIFIVTGPNQGGKTTYLQMLGLIQVLAQAGMFVPATEAKISPVDGIFSHFPVEEKLARSTGRFGDEAKRLEQIFEAATGQSLILLNETFSSTSAGESRFLAEEILRILRLMGEIGRAHV